MITGWLREISGAYANFFENLVDDGKPGRDALFDERQHSTVYPQEDKDVTHREYLLLLTGTCIYGAG